MTSKQIAQKLIDTVGFHIGVLFCISAVCIYRASLKANYAGHTPTLLRFFLGAFALMFIGLAVAEIRLNKIRKQILDQSTN